MISGRSFFIFLFSIYAGFVVYSAFSESPVFLKPPVLRLPAGAKVSAVSGNVPTTSPDPNEALPGKGTEAGLDMNIFKQETAKKSNDNIEDLKDIFRSFVKDDRIPVSTEKQGFLELLWTGSAQSFPVTALFFVLGLILMKQDRNPKSHKIVPDQGEWQFTMGIVSIDRKWNFSQKNSFSRTKIKIGKFPKDSEEKEAS